MSMTVASRARPGDRPCIPYVGRTNKELSNEREEIALTSKSTEREQWNERGKRAM